MPTPHSANPRYIAQDILSRRDHSEWELKAKLAKKVLSQADIEATVDWLKTKKLINDHAFATKYITSIIRVKPVGPRYLSHKLQQKRVNRQIIDQVLHELLGENVQQ